MSWQVALLILSGEELSSDTNTQVERLIAIYYSRICIHMEDILFQVQTYVQNSMKHVFKSACDLYSN